MESNYKYLATLSNDPKWAPRVQRIREMDFEELKAFRQEDHTGVEHNVADHYYAEKLVEDYADRHGNAFSLDAFKAQKDWTEDMRDYVAYDFEGQYQVKRLEACAKEYIEKSQ